MHMQQSFIVMLTATNIVRHGLTFARHGPCNIYIDCNLIRTVRPFCADNESVASSIAYQKSSPYPVPFMSTTNVYAIAMYTNFKVCL